jgi:zinc/manganese transport system substrate-binding protein/manganese/iron transport system substrate-binding protein
MVALARAAVVVESGAGLESWLHPTIINSGFHGLLVDASTGVPLRRLDGQIDPHIWHDPDNAQAMCRNIAAGLSTKDPAGRATYQANLDRYLARLRGLDADLRARIDRIPPRDRRLVTNHDAFGYYGRHFGLAVDSVLPSLDTSAELSGRDIQRVVARIRQTGTPAVFSESSLPAKLARTIGREAGVRVVAGEGSLYADTLGPPGSPASTYLDMEEHNTEVIVSALSGGRR